VVDTLSIKRPLVMIPFSMAKADEGAINAMGAEGWELVGVAPKVDSGGKPQGHYYYYYFKRPLQ
jgi:hypothetical protein